MKDGNCPKCGATAVYRGPTGLVATGWAARDAAFLPMTLWSTAGLTNYVCTACGYVERYVMSPDERSVIAQNWEKIEIQPSTS